MSRNPCRRFVLLASLWAAVPSFLACGHPEPPSLVASEPGADLLVAAERHERAGRSLRAEQYYLAALDAGAPRELVVPHLIATCVKGGRLQTALRHAEDELQRNPSDPRLLQLTRALRSALSRRTA